MAFCCSGCLLVRGVTGQTGEDGQVNGLLLRLGLSVFFAVNVMAFTLPAYFPIIYDVGETPGSAGYLLVLRGLALLFTCPVLILLGFPVLKQVAAPGSTRFGTVDALIVTGGSAAFVLSVWNTIHGLPHVYFDTVAMLLVLVTLGRYLEARAKLATSAQLTTLMDQLPQRSVRLRGSDEESVLTASLVPGDRIRVLPGDMLPIDGVVTSGAADFDESSLTGECRPQHRTCGDAVASGTSNLNGVLEVRVTRCVGSSTAARVGDLLKSARTERGSFQRLADQAAGIFLPAVLCLAAVTFLYWTWREGLGSGLLTALSVLVVACPCAFGIAVPAATWIALGNAARRGVLISSGAVMERLGKLQRIYFDKTGTLTRDHPELKHTFMDPACPMKPADLLELARSLQHYAPHPLVLGSHEDDLTATPQRFSDVRFHPGLGIEGRVEFAGLSKTMRVGSPRFLSESGCSMSESLVKLTRQARAVGGTVVMTGWDDRVQAVHVFRESLRAGAQTVLLQLQEYGLYPQILTGDSPVSEEVLHDLGSIPVHSGLTPDQKLEHLRETCAKGLVVGMVGDGINDAPALAMADVGIALGTKNDITRGAAHVNILEPDLRKLAWLVTYARQLRAVSRTNLWWAFGYNGVALVLAMAGRLNPLVAGLAMILSSLVILVNSRRLLEGYGMKQQDEAPQDDESTEHTLEPVTFSQG